MATDDILAAAAARLAAAWPTARDLSGEPFAAPKGKLPAFRVSLTLGAAERVAMGDPRHWRDATLTVAVWAEVERSNTPGVTGAEQVGHALFEDARTAIMADPADLAGAVWTIAAGEAAVEHDAGEKRISRADASFPLRFLEAGP